MAMHLVGRTCPGCGEKLKASEWVATCSECDKAFHTSVKGADRGCGGLVGTKRGPMYVCRSCQERIKARAGER